MAEYEYDANAQPILPSPDVSFIKLNDIEVDPYAVIAYGVAVLPETRQSEEYYVLTLWLRDVKEPVMITYDSVLKRDNDLETVRERINALRAN
jgi:hypothetical protein